MENDEMEKATVNKLIEWLEKHGHTPEEIVECIKYITKNDSGNSGSF